MRRASNLDYPSVSMDASGNFIVAWQEAGVGSFQELGIFARRYSSAGTAQDTPFRVSTYLSYNKRFPAVSQADNGDFVIAWQSFAQEVYGISSWGTFARRYDSSGRPQGPEFQANTWTTSAQLYLAGAPLPQRP